MADLIAITPLWILALGHVALLVVECVRPGRLARWPLFLTVATLLAALAALSEAPSQEEAFQGMLALDGLSRGFQALILTATLAVVLTCEPYFRELRIRAAEVYALLLASVTGMALVVAARDLMVLFLGIELLSIPLYVLAAFRRERSESVESGFKYFLMGAFASGFLVYGIALLYAASGSTRFAVVGNAGHDPTALHLAGVALLLVGLGFKIAAAPFHAWAPDVYQGAPTPVTSFMAAVVKTAGFGALLRLALEVLPATDSLRSAFVFVAVATMLVGNLGALLQTHLKRLLAWSSVGHAGYLLVGVAAASQAPTSPARTAVLFYLCTYALTTVGAFSILTALLRNRQEGEHLRNLRGLARARPFLAFAMTVCVLSLAGLPPTAGFFGKLFLFRVAWSADLMLPAVTLVVASLVSLYYYLRIVVAMYMTPKEEEIDVLPSPLLTLVTVLATAGILWVGVLPGTLLQQLG